MCIQWTRVLYSVVITRQSNPPISQFNSLCNEFTSVWSMCVYNNNCDLEISHLGTHYGGSTRGMVLYSLYRGMVLIVYSLNRGMVLILYRLNRGMVLLLYSLNIGMVWLLYNLNRGSLP